MTYAIIGFGNIDQARGNGWVRLISWSSSTDDHGVPTGRATNRAKRRNSHEH